MLSNFLFSNFYDYDREFGLILNDSYYYSSFFNYSMLFSYFIVHDLTFFGLISDNSYYYFCFNLSTYNSWMFELYTNLDNSNGYTFLFGLILNDSYY